MRTVQRTVFADHLRLHPDAEIEPQRLEPLLQPVKAVGQLFSVDFPVAKRTRIVIPRAEPAVVHHKKLRAKLRPDLCDGKELVFVKVHPRAFPVVDEHGAFPVFPCAAHDILLHKAVHAAGNAIEAACGEGEHSLRRGENLTRVKLPAEAGRVDAEQQAGLSKVRGFHDLRMAAAVNEVCGIAFALLLIRAMPLEHHERVCARRADAKLGVVHIYAGGKRLVLPLALVRPRAGEGDEVEIRSRQVEHCAHRAQQRNGRIAEVFIFRMAGDDVACVKRGIKQAYAHVRDGVFQRETVRFALAAFLTIRRRKPCERRLFREDLMGDESEIRCAASVGQDEFRHGFAEIPAPGRGKCKADVLKAKGGILPRVSDHVAVADVLLFQQGGVVLPRVQPRAVVQAGQKPVWQRCEDHARVLSIDMENLHCFLPPNRIVLSSYGIGRHGASKKLQCQRQKARPKRRFGARRSHDVYCFFFTGIHSSQ